MAAFPASARCPAHALLRGDDIMHVPYFFRSGAHYQGHRLLAALEYISVKQVVAGQTFQLCLQ
jgi:hypothetical protein